MSPQETESRSERAEAARGAVGVSSCRPGGSVSGGRARVAVFSPAAKAVLWHVVSLVLLAAGLVAVARLLPWDGWLARLEHFFEEHGLMGALVYPVLLAVCNLLLLPGGVLSLASGYLFGLWSGFALVLAGTVLGAAGAFWVTRVWLRGFVERHLLHRPRWVALDRLIEREGWRIVLLSQLNPLFPTSLVNYLYGATRMRFAPCMLWVAAGQAPGLLLYVYLGTVGKFGIQVLNGEAEASPLDFALWLGGLALGLAATVALGVIAARLWREAAESAGGGVGKGERKNGAEGIGSASPGVIERGGL